MKKAYYCIGLMSGTSLDGVDLAYVCFEENQQQYTYKLLACKTYAYPAVWSLVLKDVVKFPKGSVRLDNLNIELGAFYGNLINKFIGEFGIVQVDFVSSHGHTVHHLPKEKYTLQIGDGLVIHQLTHLPVVYDFRKQDVLLGGQGAPLVPIVDRYLFGEFDYCLNLGGFANVSYEFNCQRIAFDICAVNTVLNYYALQLGFPFDDGGQISKTGTIHAELLGKLNDLDFYQQKHPKSLGVEFVNEVIIPLIDSFRLSVKDVLRTYTAHIVQQLLLAIPKGKVLVTGGGAFNTFLIDSLKESKQIKVLIPEKDVVNFKEAVAFALLGLLKWQGVNNCLASVTGVEFDHCSGKIVK